MRFNARQAFVGLIIAGVAGGFLFLPAISFVGSMLAPTQPPLPTTHIPKLVGDALWAEFDGGRATDLQPINPFSLGRMVSCHLLAETADEERQKESKHEECMTLLPAVEGINEVSMSHLRGVGVANDPRVPFVGFATMMHVASRWSREQLLDAIGERGQWSFGFQGVEQAARGFFNRSAAELDLPQAALLARLHRNRHLDPWCGPVRSVGERRATLQRMLANGAIDDAAFQAANVAPLGLTTPPADHQPCPP